MTDDPIPEGLSEIEYARGLLDKIGWPARGNLEMMADCIVAVSKSKRLTLIQAYKYLLRAVKLAKEQGQEVNRFWFQGGDYMNVRPQRFGGLPLYKPMDRKAIEAEQSTPEWAEANKKLRETLARIAGKDFAEGKAM